MFLKYFLLALSIIIGVLSIFNVFCLFLNFVLGIGEKKERKIHTIEFIFEKEKDDEED